MHGPWQNITSNVLSQIEEILRTGWLLQGEGDQSAAQTEQLDEDLARCLGCAVSVKLPYHPQ